MRKFVIATSFALLASSAIYVVLADSSSSSSNNNGGSVTNGQSNGAKTSQTATQSRQSGVSAAASVLSAIGSLVPGLITNVAPLMLLFGLGALMMPSLGLGAMGLLRESRRSSNDQASNLPGANNFPGAFAQYARPLQTSPQDIYYFTKRSLPSFMSSLNTAGIASGLQDVLERVVRAIDNADKRYN